MAFLWLSLAAALPAPGAIGHGRAAVARRIEQISAVDPEGAFQLLALSRAAAVPRAVPQPEQADARGPATRSRGGSRRMPAVSGILASASGQGATPAAQRAVRQEQGRGHALSACWSPLVPPVALLRGAAQMRRARHYGLMAKAACQHAIPRDLFDALIIQESGYDPHALSRSMAFGLTQLMPGTARDLAVDRFDLAQNLDGGARYLRQMLDRFGAVPLALAAYNAGPGRIRKGRMPAIAETRAYVAAVLANWAALARAGLAQDPAHQAMVLPGEWQHIVVRQSVVMRF